MEYLHDLIRKEGRIFPGDILKIDSFLNHQINIEVMNKIGEEFSNIFKSIKVDKILTIETSGVAIAQATAIHMGVEKVLYAKKGEHLNMSDTVYACKEKSYTKNTEYNVLVSKEYLKQGEKILIIDDFLANGEALNALLNICAQANAEVVGIGIVVAKMYQPGYQRILKMNNNIHILAKIKSLTDDGKVEFE